MARRKVFVLMAPDGEIWPSYTSAVRREIPLDYEAHNSGTWANARKQGFRIERAVIVYKEKRR